MKTLLSFILSDWLEKEYSSIEELTNSINNLGLDGLEVIRADETNLKNNDLIQGVHLPFFTSWMDYYLGNRANLIEEFGSLEEAKSFYKIAPRDLYKYFEKDLSFAEKYANYTVFHIANISTQDYLSTREEYTSEQVIDASIEIINDLLSGRDTDNLFLIENLYYAGLNLMDPELTRRALDGINYPNKGIMLDTGHLMCTSSKIETEDEGWDYAYKILKNHQDLLPYFKGIHLHISTGGSYYQWIRHHPPEKIDDFYRRFEEIYRQVGKIDMHKIARSEKVNKIIDLVEPEYLVLEFKSSNRKEREKLAREQLSILRR